MSFVICPTSPTSFSYARFKAAPFALAAAWILLPLAVSGQVPGTGRIHITQVSSYTGGASLAKPAAIVVYDFAADQDSVKPNSGALNRVRSRVSGDTEQQKTELADSVVADFSQTLIKHLEKTGLPVRKGVAGDVPPENSLVVRGSFSAIDDGNRARRMAVGLGAGASEIRAHVVCQLTQSSGETKLSEFTATSKSSRKPGAAETMGAGAAPDVAAAAGGVTEMKQGAEGDANRMAKAVANEIAKTLQNQGWSAK